MASVPGLYTIRDSFLTLSRSVRRRPPIGRIAIVPMIGDEAHDREDARPSRCPFGASSSRRADHASTSPGKWESSAGPEEGASAIGRGRGRRPDRDDERPDVSRNGTARPRFVDAAAMAAGDPTERSRPIRDGFSSIVGIGSAARPAAGASSAATASRHPIRSTIASSHENRGLATIADAIAAAGGAHAVAAIRTLHRRGAIGMLGTNGATAASLPVGIDLGGSVIEDDDASSYRLWPRSLRSAGASGTRLSCVASSFGCPDKPAAASPALPASIDRNGLSRRMPATLVVADPKALRSAISQNDQRAGGRVPATALPSVCIAASRESSTVRSVRVLARPF